MENICLKHILQHHPLMDNMQQVKDGYICKNNNEVFIIKIKDNKVFYYEYRNREGFLIKINNPKLTQKNYELLKGYGILK